MNFRRLFLLFIFFIMSITSMDKTVYAYDTVRIAIDAGHGGTGENEQGAAYNGLEEKNVNLAIANALKSELEQYGNVEVIMTRTGDDYISIEDRVNYAISQNADYIVSIHNNASTNHLFFGSEIFVPSTGDMYCKGYSLAQPIMTKWEASGCISKGIKTRIGNNGDYYGLIRYAAQSSVPAIILEHAYLDNDNDIDRINSEYDWEKFARLDAEGIAEYFGLQKNNVKENIMENIITNTSGVVKNDTTGPTDVEFEVNSYNSKTGKVEFTLSAKENESKCMFYTVSTKLMTDEDGIEVPDVDSAMLWDGEETINGTVKVRKGYSGSLYAAVYNNYNVVSDVVEVTLSEDGTGDEIVEESEDSDNITIDNSDEKNKRKEKEEKDDEEKIVEEGETSDDSEGELLVTSEEGSETQPENYQKVDPSLYRNLYNKDGDDVESTNDTIDSQQQTLNKMMFAFVVAMTALIAGCLIIAIFTKKKK